MDGTAFCPLCRLKGKLNKLTLYQLNFDDKFYMCSDTKCPYPLDSSVGSVSCLRTSEHNLKDGESNYGAVVDHNKESLKPSNSNSDVGYTSKAMRIDDTLLKITDQSEQPWSLANSCHGLLSNETRMHLPPKPVRVTSMSKLCFDNSNSCSNLERGLSAKTTGKDCNKTKPNGISKPTDLLLTSNSPVKQDTRTRDFSDHHLQWINEDSLCWLDVSLSLLVHCKPLFEWVSNNNLQPQSLLKRLFCDYHKAQDIYRQALEFRQCANMARQGKAMAIFTSIGKITVKIGGGSCPSHFNKLGRSPVRVNSILMDDVDIDANDVNADVSQGTLSGTPTTKTDYGLLNKSVQKNEWLMTPDELDDRAHAMTARAGALLSEVRELIWQTLYAGRRRSKATLDSPVFALPQLISDSESCTESCTDLFKLNYTWTMSCDQCGYQHSDKNEKVLPSFPQTEPDFSMESPYILRPCFQCHAPRQRLQLHYTQPLPPAIVAHFADGLSNPDLSAYDFSSPGDQSMYRVKCVVQHVSKPDHFICWIRRQAVDGTSQWLKLDDLQDSGTRFQDDAPIFPPHQIHLVLWERQEKTNTSDDIMIGREASATRSNKPPAAGIATLQDEASWRSQRPPVSESPIRTVVVEPIRADQHQTVIDLRNHVIQATGKKHIVKLVLKPNNTSSLVPDASQNLTASTGLLSLPNKVVSTAANQQALYPSFDSATHTSVCEPVLEDNSFSSTAANCAMLLSPTMLSAPETRPNHDAFEGSIGEVPVNNIIGPFTQLLNDNNMDFDLCDIEPPSKDIAEPEQDLNTHYASAKSDPPARENSGTERKGEKQKNKEIARKGENQPSTSQVDLKDKALLTLCKRRPRRGPSRRVSEQFLDLTCLMSEPLKILPSSKTTKKRKRSANITEINVANAKKPKSAAKSVDKQNKTSQSTTSVKVEVGETKLPARRDSIQDILASLNKRKFMISPNPLQSISHGPEPLNPTRQRTFSIGGLPIKKEKVEDTSEEVLGSGKPVALQRRVSTVPDLSYLSMGGRHGQQFEAYCPKSLRKATKNATVSANSVLDRLFSPNRLKSPMKTHKKISFASSTSGSVPTGAKNKETFMNQLRSADKTSRNRVTALPKPAPQQHSSTLTKDSVANHQATVSHISQWPSDVAGNGSQNYHTTQPASHDPPAVPTSGPLASSEETTNHVSSMYSHSAAAVQGPDGEDDLFMTSLAQLDDAKVQAVMGQLCSSLADVSPTKHMATPVKATWPATDGQELVGENFDLQRYLFSP